MLKGPCDDINSAQQKQLLADLLSQTSQTDVYHASLAQQRLWLLDQIQGKSSAYNVHLGLWLRGPLVLDVLRVSLQEVVNRHDSLRTAFKFEGRELRQTVERNLTLSLPLHDLSHLQEPYSEAYHFAERQVEAPFDLREAPLLRARLIRITADEHVLLFVMHHIITDSWSVQIMAREIAAIYGAYCDGKPSPLSDLPISYGDYSEWQHQWLGTEQVHQQLMYWKNQLQNAPPLLELPTDGPRLPEQTFQGASQTVGLSNQVISSVGQLATRWQTTPFILLLAAFKVLLYRYSGQPDLVLGVPVAGRNRVETEGLIGFFVNTLVLRDDLSGNPRFCDLVMQIRETTLDAFANSDVPFEKVVEVLRPERNLGYNPIFQVMFSAIKGAVQSHAFGNLAVYPYVVTPTTSIFDLSMTLIEGVDGQWWAQIDHNSELFRAERIGLMLEDYIEVLQAIVAEPEVRILDLPIAGADRNKVSPMSLPGPLVPTRKERKLSSSVPNPKRSVEVAAERKLLLQIWKDVLGIPEIGTHDNFFDIGGHSLLAARLIIEIERATGRKIPVSAVFRAPTIEAFANLLKNDSVAERDSIVMRLGEGDAGIPFFTVAIPGVDVLGFAQLAHQLSPFHPVFNLQAAAPVILQRPFSETELEELSNTYLSAMRSIQPHGPYCVGSMCDGVVLAQVMIRKLESQGEEVALFAILDTWVMENSLIKPLWALDYYVQRSRLWSSKPLKEQFAMVRRTLARWIAPANNTSGSGWQRAFWPGENFQIPRFSAPVLLFKRPRQPYYRLRDPEMGWGARSLGGVEICEIECGHFEILREPHVRVISQKLRNRLQRIMLRDDRLGSSPLVKRNSPTMSESGAWAGPAA